MSVQLGRNLRRGQSPDHPGKSAEDKLTGGRRCRSHGKTSATGAGSKTALAGAVLCPVVKASLHQQATIMLHDGRPQFYSIQ